MSGMRGMRGVVLAAALGWASVAAGQDVTVRVGVEPRLIQLGETATLSIVFEGSGQQVQAPDIRLPEDIVRDAEAYMSALYEFGREKDKP